MASLPSLRKRYGHHGQLLLVTMVYEAQQLTLHERELRLVGAHARLSCSSARFRREDQIAGGNQCVSVRYLGPTTFAHFISA
jgi:hypothetical protein